MTKFPGFHLTARIWPEYFPDPPGKLSIRYKPRFLSDIHWDVRTVDVPYSPENSTAAEHKKIAVDYRITHSRQPKGML